MLDDCMTNQHRKGHARAQIIADAAHCRGCRRFWAGGRQPFPDRYERVALNSGEIDKIEGRARWIAKRWRGLDPARHSILGAFAGLLGAFACFEDFVAFLVADLDARRFTGTFPILGSPARTRSQACSAASSKSCASAGRTCPSPSSPTLGWIACWGTPAADSGAGLRV